MIIYLIKNKVNDKKYVGMTKRTLEKRWKEHKKGYSNYLLSSAIKKFGIENFEISVIDKATTEKELKEKERYWMLELKTLNPYGYNYSLNPYRLW
jgi:group I intron endonuclease